MTENFRCFTYSMARYLADDCGHPLLRKYYSEISECFIYEFAWTPELDADRLTYIEASKNHKKGELND